MKEKARERGKEKGREEEREGRKEGEWEREREAGRPGRRARGDGSRLIYDIWTGSHMGADLSYNRKFDPIFH